MRGRLVIATGGVVVLGLLLLLWQATRDSDAAEPSALASPPHRVDPVAVPVPTGPVVRDPTLPAAIVMTRPAPTSPDVARDPGGPSLGSAAEDGSAAKKPDPYTPRDRAIKNLLRKQVDAIDQYVSDCVAKSAKAGGKVTGVAQLTVAFRRGDRPGVAFVDTGISSVDSTVTDQPLLDCLAATGKHMQLDLPDGVTDVSAKHEVNLDGGTLTNHKLSAFQVHSPGDPTPTPVAPGANP